VSRKPIIHDTVLPYRVCPARGVTQGEFEAAAIPWRQSINSIESNADGYRKAFLVNAEARLSGGHDSAVHRRGAIVTNPRGLILDDGTRAIDRKAEPDPRAG